MLRVENYFLSSREIIGTKEKNRWMFLKAELERWRENRTNSTVELGISEYEECFQFAIKMAYSTNSRHGTGIRGQKSEVQMADDFILGIIAENGVAKFIKEKFGVTFNLDMELHQKHITPQDIVSMGGGSLHSGPEIENLGQA